MFDFPSSRLYALLLIIKCPTFVCSSSPPQPGRKMLLLKGGAAYVLKKKSAPRKRVGPQVKLVGPQGGGAGGAAGDREGGGGSEQEEEEQGGGAGGAGRPPKPVPAPSLPQRGKGGQQGGGDGGDGSRKRKERDGEGGGGPAEEKLQFKGKKMSKELLSLLASSPSPTTVTAPRLASTSTAATAAAATTSGPGAGGGRGRGRGRGRGMGGRGSSHLADAASKVCAAERSRISGLEVATSPGLLPCGSCASIAGPDAAHLCASGLKAGPRSGQPGLSRQAALPAEPEGSLHQAAKQRRRRAVQPACPEGGAVAQGREPLRAVRPGGVQRRPPGPLGRVQASGGWRRLPAGFHADQGWSRGPGSGEDQQPHSAPFIC